MGVDLGMPATDSPIRSATSGACADALLAELVDLALQLRDQLALERIERDRRGSEHRVLHEHEDEIVSSVPPWKTGRANASPIKPPSGSTSP